MDYHVIHIDRKKKRKKKKPKKKILCLFFVLCVLCFVLCVRFFCLFFFCIVWCTEHIVIVYLRCIIVFLIFKYIFLLTYFVIWNIWSRTTLKFFVMLVRQSLGFPYHIYNSITKNNMWLQTNWCDLIFWSQNISIKKSIK